MIHDLVFQGGREGERGEDGGGETDGGGQTHADALRGGGAEEGEVGVQQGKN